MRSRASRRRVPKRSLGTREHSYEPLRVAAPRGGSFPSSAWERKSGKLCFPWSDRVQYEVAARGCEAELRGDAFPSGAWERGNIPTSLFVSPRLGAARSQALLGNASPGSSASRGMAGCNTKSPHGNAKQSFAETRSQAELGNEGTFLRASSCRRASGRLVPKLCLGTQVREALLPVEWPGAIRSRRTGMRSRASRRRVPKRSLGT